MEALPLDVAALDYGAILDDPATRNFVGRGWLRTLIEKQLAAISDVTSDGQYVLVQAKAGLGKTALAAWLAREWECACHFSRVPGGRETRNALQSLAAQLIVRFGLHEQFALGGMLPGWSGDPAHFPRILAAAARIATDNGTTVRIIVDGLDESLDEGAAFGLPCPLPAGVQILATYREGISPRRLPVGNVHTFSIEAEDPANLEDIHRFLSLEVQDGRFAAQLSAAGITESEAIAILTERSGGVWVYLRYALFQIRLGALKVADLDRLPVGLAGYYRKNVIGRWDDPLFDVQDLPVLATFAVARQPLNRDQLCRLTGLTAPQIRYLCNYRYRPFLIVDTQAGSPSYSIYHDSLREFLHGRASFNDIGYDSIEECDLRAAIQVAHERIADHYLSVFGGLNEGMSLLSQTASMAEIDNFYPLRHLPFHLHESGRLSDLEKLLTCRHSPASRLGSIWADAHDRLGTLDEYLAAIDLARNAAEIRTNFSISAKRQSPTLASETLYALLAANLITRSSSIYPSLLEALISAEVWDEKRAVAHALRLRYLPDQIDALARIMPYINDSREARKLVTYALSAANAIDDIGDKARCLAKMVKYCEEEDRHEVLSQIIEAASEDSYDLTAGHALASITTYLTDPKQLRLARKATKSFNNELSRPEVLAALSMRFEGAERRNLLNAAIRATHSIDERWQADVLVRISAYLAGRERKKILDRASEAALAVSGGFRRVEALVEVASKLEGVQRQDLLDKAFKDAQAISDEKIRDKALAQVKVQLGETHGQELIDEALEIAVSFVGDIHFLSIVKYLKTPEQLEKAFQAVLTIDNHFSRLETSTIVASYMTDPEQLERALHVIMNMGRISPKIEALTAIAGHLTGARRKHILHHALEVANSDPDDHLRADMLVSVAAQLEGQEREKVLDSAFAALPADDMFSVGTLESIAAHTKDLKRLEKIYQIAKSLPLAALRVGLLTAVAAQFTGEKRKELLDQSLVAALSADGTFRMSEIVDVAAQLDEPDRQNILNEILKVLGKKTKWVQLDTLSSMAKHFHGPARQEIVERAQALSANIADDADRARALAIVAPLLIGEDRKKCLSQAFNAAMSITEEWAQTEALVKLARCLEDVDHLKQALQFAIDVSSPLGIDIAVAVFRQASILTDTISDGHFLGLLRQVQRSLVSQDLLLNVIGVAAERTMALAGADVLVRQADLIVGL